VRVIAEELNMNRETVRQIVKEDLGMRKISAEMVPRISTNEQKYRWLHYQQCYLEVLTRLWESVQGKRPGIWPDKWILHHDNAPAHDALRVCKFLAKNSITKMDHPPYSPDLAPCDFWLFPYTTW